MPQRNPTTLADARKFLENPAPASSPTPCFWWTGADLDRDRLDWQLRQLAEKGIGGTIVGYSHLPQGDLDHQHPAPFSPEWWDLFRWFVGRSAELGMTANIQEFCVIGPVLRRAAARTVGLHPGTLVEASIAVGGACRVELSGEGDLVSLLAIRGGTSETIAIPVSDVDNGALQWSEPGEWTISTIRLRGGVIDAKRTAFDPMHPDAADAVIDLFYRRFEEELPGLFGSAFKIFFQDELDLGITMPMWNDLVAAELETEFDLTVMKHALWHDLGPDTSAYRARYRAIVVDLLERHYFRPIFEWIDARGCLLIMDQLSRGDLRLGQHHYADFLETMRWYHGPGNDDPDLRGPRNRFAFAVSSSIAQLDDRPLIPNEAFHSSGWGVAPVDILRGLNEGFAAGANHVIMHGLNFTTEGGWWEWASPDFHFRQPWWNHSQPLWDYISRASSLLQAGSEQTDILVIDPSADLVVEGPDSIGPERVTTVVEKLLDAGIRPTLAPLSRIASATVDGGQLTIGRSTFSIVVSPGARHVSAAAQKRLHEFEAGGGRVLAVDALPNRSQGSEPQPEWQLIDESQLAGMVLSTSHSGVIVSQTPGVRVRRRVLLDGTIFFVTNHTGTSVMAKLCIPDDLVEPELWDLQTGLVGALPASGTPRMIEFELSPDYAVVVAGRIGDSTGSTPVLASLPLAAAVVAGVVDGGEQFEFGPWTIEIEPTLDNRFLDFSSSPGDLGVESVRVDVLSSDGHPVPSIIDHGVRMMALGPISPVEAADIESWLPGSVPNFDQPVVLEDRAVAWRPYVFSPTTGLDRDPLLLDTMTGPHGLKGVPPEFIDPLALDSDAAAGSLYYFTAAAPSPTSRQILRAGGRAAYAVWVDGTQVVFSPEDKARVFPPWSLRDMSVVGCEIEVDTPNSTTQVLLRVEVSADQPTRAWVVMGGDGGANAPRSRLRWWWGDAPSAPFSVAGVQREVTLRVTPPPGAVRLEVTAHGPVIAASIAGLECPISADNQESGVDGQDAAAVVSVVTLEPDATWSAGSLDLTIATPVDLGTTAGAITRPLRWRTRPIRVDRLGDWAEWGLSDFSGIVRYSTTVDADRATSAQLRVDGPVGSARVILNGRAISTIYSPDAPVVLELIAGLNTIEIECANTLANYYGRWPSPFSANSGRTDGSDSSTSNRSRPHSSAPYVALDD
ncbi:hypothetical protein [Salinibacterium sp.]|uniref:hypothetical protein n=1 Tax=Salinibacterium sp. TaxID=1915057 RepID=UPI00286B61E9|nr:hypothetical protein [Salinibacterium sp.]